MPNKILYAAICQHEVVTIIDAKTFFTILFTLLFNVFCFLNVFEKSDERVLDYFSFVNLNSYQYQ